MNARRAAVYAGGAMAGAAVAAGMMSMISEPNPEHVQQLRLEAGQYLAQIPELAPEGSCERIALSALVNGHVTMLQNGERVTQTLDDTCATANEQHVNFGNQAAEFYHQAAAKRLAANDAEKHINGTGKLALSGIGAAVGLMAVSIVFGQKDAYEKERAKQANKPAGRTGTTL